MSDRRLPNNVGTGLVASLAQPGGNLTGLTDLAPGLVAKRLEVIKEVIPSATRIAVLLDPDNARNQSSKMEV